MCVYVCVCMCVCVCILNTHSPCCGKAWKPNGCVCSASCCVHKYYFAKVRFPLPCIRLVKLKLTYHVLASLTFLAKVSHQLAGSCVSAWEYKISSPLNSLLPEGEPKSCLTLFYSRVGTEVWLLSVSHWYQRMGEVRCQPALILSYWCHLGVEAQLPTHPTGTRGWEAKWLLGLTSPSSTSLMLGGVRGF